MNIEAQFPVELPEVALTRNLHQVTQIKSLNDALVSTLDSVFAGLHFGSTSLTERNNKSIAVVPDVMSVLLALEELFAEKNDAIQAQVRSRLQQWPVWDANLRSTGLKTCVGGYPYLSWSTSDRDRVVSKFDALCGAESPPSIRQLLLFLSDVNDPRCLYILARALRMQQYSNGIAMLNRMQASFQRCMGWSVST